jgi:tetratricopeptide (TPR) repeat protein
MSSKAGTRRWLGGWAAVGLLGCERACGPAAPGAVVDAGVAAAPKEVDADSLASNPALAGVPRETLALALRRPGDAAAVDKEILTEQRRIGTLPGKPDLWLLLGRAWVRKARELTDPVYYLNADACADVASQLDPHHVMGLELKGLALLNDHKFKEAAALAQGVLAQQPEHLIALSILSDADLELGDVPGAIAAAQKMVDVKPNLPSYSRASYLMWLRGDGKGALSTARLAMSAGDERSPEPFAWVTVQAGMMFWHQGDLDGAVAGADRALDVVRDYPPALVLKARGLVGQGKPKDAAALLEKAYGKSPLVETAWLWGDALELAGDHAGAEAAWARVRKEGARSDPRTLAQFLTARGEQTDQAIALLQKEREGRDDLYTRDALAFALLRAGKVAEARPLSDQALALGTPDARLLFHAGAIRLAGGDASGRALLEQALKLNPTFDRAGALEARALLAAKK